MEQLPSWLNSSVVAAYIVGILTALVPVAIYLDQRKREAKRHAEVAEYQRRQTEIEEGRRREEVAQAEVADIRVSIRSELRTDRRGRQKLNYFLDFVNHGGANARNLNLESFTPKDADTDAPGVDRDMFPVPELLPGDRATCAVQLWGSSFEAVITWEDSSGHHRETRTVTR
jgi:hypothetical protein